MLNILFLCISIFSVSFSFGMNSVDLCEKSTNNLIKSVNKLAESTKNLQKMLDNHAQMVKELNTFFSNTWKATTTETTHTSNMNSNPKSPRQLPAEEIDAINMMVSLSENNPTISSRDGKTIEDANAMTSLNEDKSNTPRYKPYYFSRSSVHKRAGFKLIFYNNCSTKK